jgi:hypothetical protein
MENDNEKKLEEKMSRLLEFTYKAMEIEDSGNLPLVKDAHRREGILRALQAVSLDRKTGCPLSLKNIRENNFFRYFESKMIENGWNRGGIKDVSYENLNDHPIFDGREEDPVLSEYTYFEVLGAAIFGYSDTDSGLSRLSASDLLELEQKISIYGGSFPSCIEFEELADLLNVDPYDFFYDILREGLWQRDHHPAAVSEKEYPVLSAYALECVDEIYQKIWDEYFGYSEYSENLQNTIVTLFLEGIARYNGQYACIVLFRAGAGKILRENEWLNDLKKYCYHDGSLTYWEVVCDHDDLAIYLTYEWEEGESFMLPEFLSLIQLVHEIDKALPETIAKSA